MSEMAKEEIIQNLKALQSVLNMDTSEYCAWAKEVHDIDVDPVGVYGSKTGLVKYVLQKIIGGPIK